MTVYRASWVCPVDRPPIANGAVVVGQNEIRSVAPFSSLETAPSQVIDLGSGAIVPGLVNAHTHLEFSELATPLGEPGNAFTDWIRLVVSRRNASNDRQTKSAAIEKGLDESSRSGVWAIGEIATAPFRLDDYCQGRNPQSIRFFLEQLGRDESILAKKQDELSRFLDFQPDGDARYNFGASPHAPYSVGPKLLQQICRQAASARCPIAMHVAETPSELELLTNQTGELVALLKDFGVWDPRLFGDGFSILEILQSLSTVPRSLVIHGNYLTDPELDFVASQSGRMSIVYCPRTHKFFGHDQYPLEKMLKRSIQVGIGTDSRASNPDLDLFQELKHVSRTFPDLEPQLILAMGTLHGARALGLDDRLGSLTIGKQAALSFIAQPDAVSGESSVEWILGQESTCCPVVIESENCQ